MNLDDAVLLESWYVEADAWAAPEQHRFHLVGTVDEVGRVTTTYVVVVDGRYVQTRSGTTYRLGTIDADYLDFLRSNDYQFDPEHPIRKVSTVTKLTPRKPT